MDSFVDHDATRDGSAPASAGASQSRSPRTREGAVGFLATLLRPVLPLGERLCRWWWAAAVRARARQVGPRVYVYGPVSFLGTADVRLGGHGNLYDRVLFETVDHGRIDVGDHFRINRGTLISAHERITIGNHCLIGEYVSIRDNHHAIDDPMRPMLEQGYVTAPITIEDDVWIGRGAAVLAGVTLGRGAVIGANSVVTRSVPPGEVWVGAPARFLRRRGEKP